MFRAVAEESTVVHTGVRIQELGNKNIYEDEADELYLPGPLGETPSAVESALFSLEALDSAVFLWIKFC